MKKNVIVLSTIMILIFTIIKVIGFYSINIEIVNWYNVKIKLVGDNIKCYIYQGKQPTTQSMFTNSGLKLSHKKYRMISTSKLNDEDKKEIMYLINKVKNDKINYNKNIYEQIKNTEFFSPPPMIVCFINNKNYTSFFETSEIGEESNTIYNKSLIELTLKLVKLCENELNYYYNMPYIE